MTLRRTPADFVVVERPALSLLASLASRAATSTPHAVYRLRKESMTTPEAVARLARALGARPDHASYAGLKDKHAITTQLISVRAPARTPERVPEPPEERWSGEFVGWTTRELRAADIDANVFTIVARDLARETGVAMDRRRESLLRHDDLLVTNYFGDQRFGSARHGKGFAVRALLRADPIEAIRLAVGTPARKDSGRTRAFTRACASHWGDWERLARDLPRCAERRPFERLAAGADAWQAYLALPHFLRSMCDEAYQSYLWNAAARSLVESIAGPRALRSDDAFGAMLFLPEPLVAREIESYLAPLASAEGKPDAGPLAREWEAAAAGALAGEGLTADSLRSPRPGLSLFGPARRPLVVRARGFRMGELEPDDLTPRRFKRVIEFELPRGAYATVVLRALGH